MSDQIIGFKAGDIVALFSPLKTKAKTGDRWWKDYIQFEWNNIRPGKNNTKWVSIKFRNNNNVGYSRLNIIIVGEIHTGQIMPNRLEDVAEIKAKNPDTKVEQRQLKASLQFQKWSKQVPTQEDKVSLIIENGKPVVPDDEFLSKYFQAVEYIDEIFKTEINERIERYMSIMFYLSQNKNLPDTSETVNDIRNNIGHVIDGDTIIQENEYKTLKDKFPKHIEELTKGFIKVNSNKCGSIIQEYISDKAIKNKGLKLPNPITRITIPFDLKGDPQNLTILDKDKAFKLNNKMGFDLATINNKPVNADTIHKLIISRCIIDGVICMDSLCFSQIGISLPIKASTIIVKQPNKRENSIFNVCQEIYGVDSSIFENKKEDENKKEYEEDNKKDDEGNKSDNEDVDSIIEDLQL